MHRFEFGAWRSLASALEWGSRGRRFESCRPDFFPKQALGRERQRAFSIQGLDLRRPAEGSNTGFRADGVWLRRRP